MLISTPSLPPSLSENHQWEKIFLGEDFFFLKKESVGMTPFIFALIGRLPLVTFPHSSLPSAYVVTWLYLCVIIQSGR